MEHPDGDGSAQPPLVLLKQAIPLLASLLHDDSADVRRLALEALGAFRDPAIVPDFAVLLLDKKEDIRFSALHAIEAVAIGPAAADGYIRADEGGWVHPGTERPCIRADPTARREAEAVLRAYVEREGKQQHIDEDLRTEAVRILEHLANYQK